MHQQGEVTIDQAHRGYSLASDTGGFRSVNPLFMKYTPTGGRFSGQQGYGYRSIEAFIDAVSDVQVGNTLPCEYDTPETVLASVATTYRTTAILEAGRMSLDNSRTVEILYENQLDIVLPTGLKLI
jgi:D-galacturonate reductase